MIHPTAIVDPQSEIAEDVSIGAYCVIGARVKIGQGSILNSHVVMQGPTTIGRNNHIFSYASIGQDPQDKKYKGEASELIIGDDNVIREFTTLNRGTEADIMKTEIGNDNLLMAYVHIAHDCIIGNHAILANAASLAGHVIVEDHAILSGFTGVHQFCRVGKHAFIGTNTTIKKDLPPFMLAAGEPPKTYGPNSTGLERAGFSAEQIALLKQAWRDLIREPTEYKKNKQRYLEIGRDHPDIAYLIDFIEQSQRGIIH